MDVKSKSSGTGDGEIRRRPASRSLPDRISRQIAVDYLLSGKVTPGALLPPEKELCERYGVSRPTVRSAIKSLHDHGVISVRNGVGAVVLPRGAEIPHRLDSLASIDTFALESGHTIETAQLAWETTTADSECSRKLRIPAGDEVVLGKRLKVVDGAPAAWIIDAMPSAIVDVEDVVRRFEGSVLDALMDNEGWSVDYADSEIQPAFCDAELSRTLKKPVGSLLLFMDTTVMDTRARPLVWGRVWLDPSKFRFSFRRRRFG